MSALLVKIFVPADCGGAGVMIAGRGRAMVYLAIVDKFGEIKDSGDRDVV